MRECIRCKVGKEPEDFPLAPIRIGRSFVPIICEQCTSEQSWIDQFPPGTDCVYLVAGGNLHKIGSTNRLATRLSSLRTMSPVPLVLEHVWAGTRLTEFALHRRYKKRRHHGEWFTFSEAEIEELKEKPLPPSASSNTWKKTLGTNRRVVVKGHKGN
jgi:T5orf172 domain